jgi:hypothetical protein
VKDWCALHPTGTKGQFNYFWATLDQDSTKARLIPPSARSRSLTHRQTYQAKEKAEKKVSLCVLLTIYLYR